MALSIKKIRVGIVGCGAIGSRIAKSIRHELKTNFELAGLFDIKTPKAIDLEKILSGKKLTKKSLKELLRNCDLVVEAVNAPDTTGIIKEAIKAKKHVLAMSVGKLLNAAEIFRLATKNHC